MINLVLFGIAFLLLVLNLIREIFVFRDIKSTFYCEHCNHFNKEISRNDKCEQCHRKMKIKGKTWEHLILHRVNWIPTKSKSDVFKWVEYRKLSVIEISINIGMMLILGIAILLEVSKIWTN